MGPRPEEGDQLKSAETRLYEQHSRLIHDRALSFSRTTGHPTDELVSEGHLVFMKACATWDKKKSRFGTWLYRNLTQRFCTVTRKAQRIEYTLLKEDLMPHYREFDPIARIQFKEILNNLTDEARYVAEIILSGPNEVLDLIIPRPPKMVRGALSRYLQRQGWRYAKVLAIFREIKEALV